MSGVTESLLELSTKVPYDPRFANHNVMKSCWLSYVQYHNCWANNQDEPNACSLLGTDVNNRCAQPQVSFREIFTILTTHRGHSIDSS